MGVGGEGQGSVGKGGLLGAGQRVRAGTCGRGRAGWLRVRVPRRETGDRGGGGGRGLGSGRRRRRQRLESGLEGEGRVPGCGLRRAEGWREKAGSKRRRE